MENKIDWNQVMWLRPIVMTPEGVRAFGEKRALRKAVFLGLDRDGFIKILFEDRTTPQVHSPDFWKPL